MGRKQDCYQKIKEMMPELKPAAIRSIMEELDNIRSRIFQDGEAELTKASFNDKAKQFLDQKRFEQAAKVREAAENAMKQYRLVEYLKQDAFKADPVEGIKALFGGTARIAESGNKSIDNLRAGFLGTWSSTMWTKLKAAGLDKVALDGGLDRDVAQAMSQMKEGGSLEGIPSQAVEMAKIFKAVADMRLKTLQQAGSSVKELDGYVTRQSHDAAKIKSATFDQWMADTLPLLDTDRTFGVSASTEKIQQVMKGVYNDILSGSYSVGGPERTGNISDKTSQSRSLHFEDGHAWYDYNQKYGTMNLTESILSNLDRSSRQAALMYQFGTNPSEAFDKLLAKAREIHAENPEIQAKLNQNADYLRTYFKTAAGLSSAPGTSMLARAGQNVRALESMSKLGSALFTSWQHWVAASSAIRSATGENMFSVAGRMVGDYLSGATSAAERATMAERLGIFVDDLHGELYSQLGADGAGPGVMSNLQRVFSKTSGLDPHIVAGKMATSKQIAMRLADEAGKSYDDLSPWHQATLDRHGIDEKMWDGLRQAVETLPDGRNKVITPEAVRAQDASVYGGEKQKFDAETSLLSLYNDFAAIGGMHPGTRQKALLLQGTKDEGFGVFLRMVAQFKSVPLLALDLSERALMSNPETRPTSLKEALLERKGDINGLSQAILFGLVMGYVGMSARAAFNGKTPPDPNKLSTWTEAAVKGGGAGLYGDFLFGQFHDGHTAADALLGPAVGEGMSLMDIWSGVREGGSKRREAEGQLLKQAINSVPFHNVFWAKQGFDYLLLNQAHEWLNPGYLRRQEQHTRQDGQDYLSNYLRPTNMEAFK